MKIGFVGLGKLGFPLAFSMARHHDVVGYDVSPAAKEILRSRVYPHREIRAQEYLTETTMRVADTVEEVVAHAEVLFLVVQTPHHPDYEGVTRLPETRVDFDYTFLKAAVAEVVAAARRLDKRVVLTVMSTVLPGTVEREVKPLLDDRLTPLCYTPAFPAMGTAIPDFEDHPEFVLLGVDDTEAAKKVRAVYEAYIKAPVVEMSVASAEATKVAYNSMISMKIGIANTWMEICHRLGANVDDVTRALSLAKRRIVSPAYMRGGMGDGGGCLTPGTLVYGERGPRPVSAVWSGDRVLASDGAFRAVVDTYKRPYKGPIFVVKVVGLPPAKFTPNHPFVVALDPIQEIIAERIRPGDTVYFPTSDLDIPSGSRRVESVDLEEYEGTVWNLHVEGTHDYVTSAGTVANCHPRDNIALSWLSHELGMKYDLFGDVMAAREAQTAWLADLCGEASRRSDLPIVILGKAFKSGTALTTGSPATLLKNILDERGVKAEQWDPHVDGARASTTPAVFFVATDHAEFYQMTFAAGSVVIDPWGKMADREGVEVVRVGRR